jgi:hypothetical protein
MYSYEYKGIYILDKNGKQTRLFDYIDGVDGNEEIIYIDTDSDGDDDIVYRIENSLYYKENYKFSPDRQHYTGFPVEKDIEDFFTIDKETTNISPAPNYFEENFSTSDEINF